MIGPRTIVTLAALAAAAVQPAAAQPAQVADDYPVQALREGHEGTATIRLAVDEADRPEACTIVESSGWPELDAASCQRAMRRSPFKPALNAKGEPIKATYRARLQWAIPKDDQPGPAPETASNTPAPGNAPTH